MPCFYSCQLTIIWKSIIRFEALTLDRKFDISHWLPCGADGGEDGRADGRTGVRSRDYQISRMDSLPNFLGMGLRSQAREATLLVLSITI